ncbi:NADP-dependent oxidoreductase [Pedobacter sp. SYSU D00535]|uniref:NADP-dependent oxidoreductase n=1 Tax=Pedobacter sp. SYSU D00535 TaxID=2810308 RepID=UPI001A95DEA4|nr:NADP-dependent oxidoreductase [Pedobacter sp. SYSU D00535]
MTRLMKAAVYKEFGSADKIALEQIAVPELKEGEVLIRIRAAGVNPVDSAVREGYLQSFIPVEFPAIPGWDVAGVVEDRAYSARRFEPGDEVYAYARRPVVQHGTFAEYIVLPESYLALKPRTLTFSEAAGIPLVGLTAMQSLIDAGRLQEGQVVLILGASGGIGTMGIQIAKEKGAKVVGVASQTNHEYMKELGADHTIDYRDTDIAAELRDLFGEGVDLIFDAASGETLQKSLASLKPDGKLVSILNTGEDLPKDLNFKYVFVEPNSRQLEALAEMADRGKLKVHLSNWYPLAEAAAAMRQIETHHTKGKIVIVP